MTNKISNFRTIQCISNIQGFTSGSIASTYLGAQGLFVALILGILIPLLSKKILDKGWYIHMPEGVPPMVERTFAALVPTLIIVVAAALIEYGFSLTEYGNFIAWFYRVAQKPFTNIGTTLPSILILCIVGGLVNFLGIHNGFVTSMWVPLLYAASDENINAIANGETIPNIISDPFRSYIFMGGTGALLGLELVLLLFCKSDRIKKVSKIAAVPSIFNINEPLLFGLPIMLNPVMLIPFVLAPTANAIVAYTAHALGLVPRLNGAIISWAMPTFIRIYLAGGGFRGVILVAVLLGVDMLIYYPFAKTLDHEYLKEENKSGETNESTTTKPERVEEAKPAVMSVNK